MLLCRGDSGDPRTALLPLDYIQVLGLGHSVSRRSKAVVLRFGAKDCAELELRHMSHGSKDHKVISASRGSDMCGLVRSPR
jgi:hypothetical protein